MEERIHTGPLSRNNLQMLVADFLDFSLDDTTLNHALFLVF